MSLYKARDWWTVTCGSDEEFEARSVVIGTIEDNASKPDTAWSSLLLRSSCCVEFRGLGKRIRAESRGLNLKPCRAVQTQL